MRVLKDGALIIAGLSSIALCPFTSGATCTAATAVALAAEGGYILDTHTNFKKTETDWVSGLIDFETYRLTRDEYHLNLSLTGLAGTLSVGGPSLRRLRHLSQRK